MKNGNEALAAKHQPHKAQKTGKKVHPGNGQKLRLLKPKKHQHIWLLDRMGLRNEVIMKLAHCNRGELYNVRKAYRKNRNLKRAAVLLFVA